MTAALAHNAPSLIGDDLRQSDYGDLEKRWINPIWADLARLRHVDHFCAKEFFSGRKGDYEGVAIPYFLPSSTYPITWRLRRANPDIDVITGQPKGKYLSAPGDRNHIYVPPLVKDDDLRSPETPILITEGEFKGIALRRLASDNAATPRFIPVALSGVHNWRGTIGADVNPNGVRVALKGVIPEFQGIAWSGRRVIVAFDADAQLKPQVRAARFMLSAWLRERGAQVGFLDWQVEDGKGIDDWLARVGPAAVLAAIERVDFNVLTGWKAKLLCTQSGKPKPLVENARVALEHAPELAGIQLNEFSGKILLPSTIPWTSGDGVWVDEDSIELAAWLQRNGLEVGKDVAFDATQIVAKRNRVHPVRDYLEKLEWDGTPRIPTWLERYVGVQTTGPRKPEIDLAAYSAAVGKCWLISAVARIFNPGCQADCMLVLEGPQGIFKSSVGRVLGGEWFNPQMPKLDGKEASIQVMGRWICEIAELRALLVSDNEATKDYLSRTVDIFRPPYGRGTIESKRQCVFLGTVNLTGTNAWMRDETGGRRFWPVRCGTIDIEALRRDRDQLWAEAVHLFREGHQWWLTAGQEDLARVEQAARFDEDVWSDRVNTFISGMNDDYLASDGVSVPQVLFELGVETSRQTQREKKRVAEILKRLGFTKYHRSEKGTRSYRYVREREWESA